MEYPLSSDIGNRITELSKAVVRIHSDMKVVQQLLTVDGHNVNDALTKDGSSILGKYIIGAKNNFRGFTTRQEDKSTPLKVTVHHGEEGAGKEKVDSDVKQESGAQQNQECECGTDGSKQVTECDVVKMEEGRATAELGDDKEAEKKEQGEAVRNENTDNKVKEEVVAGTSFNNVGEKVKAEDAQVVAERQVEGGILAGGEKHTETTPKQAESVKVNNEKTGTKSIAVKFKDIELQEKKVDAKWMKGRKVEHNVAEKCGVREGSEKPGAKKTIPSPTGSSSSQDTGFGSQEGEGSIDGVLVRP